MVYHVSLSGKQLGKPGLVLPSATSSLKIGRGYHTLSKRFELMNPMNHGRSAVEILGGSTRMPTSFEAPHLFLPRMHILSLSRLPVDPTCEPY